MSISTIAARTEAAQASVRGREVGALEAEADVEAAASVEAAPAEASELDAPMSTEPTRLETGDSRRRAGAGTAGLALTEVGRSDKLAAMRAGELGSVHSWELVTAVDGPGTRMTVFLSGCPMRCLYCHNPDTMAMRDGKPVLADDLLARIKRYRGIFRATGGGLTISGGEALMQPAFVARILRGAAFLGIHTALDTSGFLGVAATDEMLDDTDLVLLDVKAGGEELYKRVTGRSLAPTLEFGRRIARRGLGGKRTEIWLRYVLVPGLTDDPESIESVARYAVELNEVRPGTVGRVEVLPFHQMGRDKWAELGKTYELADTEPPSAELTEQTREVFRSRGLTTY